MTYAAAACTGRKDTTTSYFMSHDPELLSIMKDQGLDCFVSMLQMQRGPRVGMEGCLFNMMERQLLTCGNLRDTCGGWQRAACCSTGPSSRSKSVCQQTFCCWQPCAGRLLLTGMPCLLMQLLFMHMSYILVVCCFIFIWQCTLL